MKKIIGLAMAFVVLCGSVWGQSLSKTFGDTMKEVNDLSKGKSVKTDVVSGTLPKGRDILPALWSYTHTELKSEDEKIVAQKAELVDFNVIEKKYKLSYKIYYKAGIGIQSQESVLDINSDESNFTVQTLSMRVFNVNKNLQHTGDGADNSVKSLNQNSKNFVQFFEKMITDFTDEEYNKWNDAARYDFRVQISVSQQAPNKLKAKRWYDSNSIKGKEIEIPFLFTSIKETKKDGYTLELSGLCGLAENVLVTVYSNNDKYIDTKDNQVLTIKGIVSDIKYTDTDFDKDYKIKRVFIEEK